MGVYMMHKGTVFTYELQPGPPTDCGVGPCLNERKVEENEVLSIQSHTLVVADILWPDTVYKQPAKPVLGELIPVASCRGRPVKPPLTSRQGVVRLRVATDERNCSDVAEEAGCGVGENGCGLGLQ